MGKLTLIQRFSILCNIALIFFSAVFGLIFTEMLEHAWLKRSKQETANIVAGAGHKELRD